MTWLERILATECPDGHGGGGEDCGRPKLGLWFCAARIQAAEGADSERAVGSHRLSMLDMRLEVFVCDDCGVHKTRGRDGRPRYSHDNGATWKPGPDACPGRRP